VATMAWRILMMPTFPAAVLEAAVLGVCDQPAVLTTHAAAKAAVRVNVLRDRSAVNSLEFTFFSLWWLAPAKPGPTCAKSAWLCLNCFRSPAGSAGVQQTSKYSRRAFLPAITKRASHYLFPHFPNSQEPLLFFSPFGSPSGQRQPRSLRTRKYFSAHSV
jgi:hypothetical protein